MNSLLALFASAFVAATLLPGGSEIALAYLAKTTSHSIAILVGVATLGNTLGGMTSWLLGRLLPQANFSTKQQTALARINRWGAPALLFSWVPVIGDPLCVAAGWLRIRWWLALLFIGIGKFARYVLIAAFL